MKVTLWGTRGSIGRSGESTIRYGGDTASVEVRDSEDNLVILDAGSGIRRVRCDELVDPRIDILLTHLHMDHVQGLPFFKPLLSAKFEVHVWGPASTLETLKQRLSRYISPPLFPVSVRDLPEVEFHDVEAGEFEVGNLKVRADLIAHPGLTLGFRLEENGSSVVYLPDHEPALGMPNFFEAPEWTSGYGLAAGTDVLIHDSQYTDEEYADRVGWGHSSFSQLSAFAELADINRLVTFHHDPSHDDDMLDDVHEDLSSRAVGYEVVPGTFGLTLEA